MTDIFVDLKEMGEPHSGQNWRSTPSEELYTLGASLSQRHFPSPTPTNVVIGEEH